MTSEQVTLPITGMTCAACQHHVESALRDLPGVNTADVNLLANKATVTFDPRAVRLEALIDAIREAGYDSALPAATPGPKASSEEALPHLLLRAALALAAACVAMALTMSPLGMEANQGIHVFQLILTAAVMLFASRQTYLRAWQAARRRATNMNTLVALGTLAAFTYSAAATIAPYAFTRSGLAPDVYFEAVLFILAFLLLGSWLDARARARATDALRGFQDLEAATAIVLRNGAERTMPLASVLTGDTVLVRPGDRIPVDGTVLTGTSTVDQALLTGESIPVPKSPGDPVIGGTINLDAPLSLQATTVGAASLLAQMRRLLEQAQMSRAPMQALADRASAIFVPIVLALALLTLAAWLAAGAWLGSGWLPVLPKAISAAVAVLIIACPCAMGLAVPAAVTVAIGRAAQMGILIKGGEALERLAAVDTIALDKTGTLTCGQPRIVSAHFTGTPTPTQQTHLIHLAAALERQANHPIARAVTAYASSQPAPPHPITIEDLKIIPGQGITASFEGQPVTLGNSTLLSSHCIEIAPTDESASTLLHLAIGKTHVLTLQAEDELRATAAPTLKALQPLSITPHILTGDRRQAAENIAKQLAISPAQVHSELLPAAKLGWIRQAQQSGHRVAMAGDGVNDAAALAQSDAGFAIGSGTDLARDAGDIVLLAPTGTLSLTAIPDAIRIARRTVRTMRQNLGWAIIYNLFGIPLAAGVLYPHFHLLLSPIVASAAMALSSTSVLLNSLRLKSFR